MQGATDDDPGELKLETTKLKFTNAIVRDAIKRHSRGEWARLWDTVVPGLFVRFTPKGHASFGVRYPRPGRQPGDHTIGPARVLAVDVVRDVARERLGRVYTQGVDLNAEKRAQWSMARERDDRATSLTAMAERYLAEVKMGDKTRTDHKSKLRKWINPRFGNRHPDDVTEQMIRALQRHVLDVNSVERAEAKKSRGGVRAATALRSFLSAAYNWGMGQGLCTKNPASFKDGIDDSPDKRMRALSAERVKVMWKGLDERALQPENRVAALALKLALITLQRPNEIIKSNRVDFDWGDSTTWRPGENRHKTWTKIKRPLFVPLTSEAEPLFRELFDLSDSPWALPGQGPRKGSHCAEGRLRDLWISIREELFGRGELDTDDLDLYDAKRFGRTFLEKKLGVSSRIAEMVISHAVPEDISTTYVVDDGDDLAEIRDAHHKWTAALMQMVGKSQ